MPLVFEKLNYCLKTPISGHLTKRQIEVVYHLLNGRTAKESANIMNLSYRTVEVYLAQIKSILRCRHKNEIFLKFDLIKFLQYYLSEAT